MYLVAWCVALMLLYGRGRVNLLERVEGVADHRPLLGGKLSTNLGHSSLAGVLLA
jgi:hypothetical protein